MHKATYIASYKSRVIRECSRAKNNYENRKLNDEALADEIQSLLSHDGKGDIELNTKELCIIISTLVNLNVNRTTKAKIFIEWQVKASANIKSFIPQNIANTLTAISKLKIDGNVVFNQEELEALLDELIGRARATIKSFNSQEIANTLTAISKLKIERNINFNQVELKEFLDKLIKKASEKIENFIPQNIANTLTAISKLKIEGNINFDQVELKALLDKLIKRASEKIEGFNSQEIANTLLALINLEFEQEEIKGLLSRLIESAVENIESFTAQNIANFLWALSVLDQDSIDSQFKQKIIIKLGKFSVEDFTIGGKTQLFQALTYYNMTDILGKLRITSEVIKQSLGAPSSSTLHKLVEKNLEMIITNTAGCSIESEFFLSKISSHIDMKLQYKGKDYYIEVDGPYHFNARGEYTLIDLFHNKLFTQTCPDEVMIRLPYFLLETQTEEQTIQGPHLYDKTKIEIVLKKILENIEKLGIESGVFIASQEGLEKITEISAKRIAGKKVPEPKIGLGRGRGLRSQEMPENKLKPEEVKWPTPSPSKRNDFYNKAEVEAKDRPGALTDPWVTRGCGRGQGGYTRS